MNGHRLAGRADDRVGRATPLAAMGVLGADLTHAVIRRVRSRGPLRIVTDGTRAGRGGGAVRTCYVCGVAKLRITYNAPVVLTFALLAVVVYVLPGSFTDPKLDPHSLKTWFAAYPHLGEPYGARSYVGLFSHILGHANWEHLLGNFMLILLIGPILEERHGSASLLGMILITALVTGLANVVLSNHVLIGASGVVFMMILLASTANIRQGEIPLTFIAIALVYLGGELYRAFQADDGVSHMAHLIGGAVGAAFGFIGARGRAAPAKKLDVGKLDIGKLDAGKRKLPG